LPPLSNKFCNGWIPDFEDLLIRDALWRPLVDPRVVIEGAPAERGKSFEPTLGGVRPTFAKRSDETSADSVRARRLAKEAARLLGRKTA
jgi:hypothetical protein